MIQRQSQISIYEFLFTRNAQGGTFKQAITLIMHHKDYLTLLKKKIRNTCNYIKGFKRDSAIILGSCLHFSF